MTLCARTPQAAQIRLLRDGQVVAVAESSELSHSIELPGVYRVEASLDAKAWIYSNPVYLRTYS